MYIFGGSGTRCPTSRLPDRSQERPPERLPEMLPERLSETLLLECAAPPRHPPQRAASPRMRNMSDTT